MLPHSEATFKPQIDHHVAIAPNVPLQLRVNTHTPRHMYEDLQYAWLEVQEWIEHQFQKISATNPGMNTSSWALSGWKTGVTAVTAVGNTGVVAVTTVWNTGVTLSGWKTGVTAVTAVGNMGVVAVTIVWNTGVTAVAASRSSVLSLVDACNTNYRYLNAAREYERRLHQNLQTVDLQTTDFNQNTHKTTLGILPTRQTTINAIAALAEINPEEVSQIALYLEKPVRGVERFRYVEVPSYLTMVPNLWQQITPLVWAQALYGQIKTGLFMLVSAMGVLAAVFLARLDIRILRFVEGLLVVALAYFYLVIE